MMESKAQQKFFGIVRSIQKGDAPASKFNKDARKAAKEATRIAAEKRKAASKAAKKARKVTR